MTANNIACDDPRKGARIVAFVTDAHGGFGGISQYNRDALEAFCTFEAVREVWVLPRSASLQLGRLHEKLKYELNGVGGTARYVFNSLKWVFSAGSVDLVYCAHINLVPLAALAATILRAPLVLAVYGVDVWRPAGRLPSRLIAKLADCVISISQLTLDRFRTWCPIPLERTFLVPNAIKLDDYGQQPKNAELLRRLGLENRTVLISVGRMSIDERSKGFDRMIEIIPRLVADIPDLAYLLVGDGTERPLLEAKAASLCIKDRVVFAGRVGDTEKPDYYRLGDVFVMLSVADGFGFVVLEALACGLPAVVSSRDGTREAVREGEFGTIVDPFDPEAVRRAILDALKRPRHVPERLDYFSYPRFVERLHNALTSVCAL